MPWYISTRAEVWAAWSQASAGRWPSRNDHDWIAPGQGRCRVPRSYAPSDVRWYHPDQWLQGHQAPAAQRAISEDGVKLAWLPMNPVQDLVIAGEARGSRHARSYVDKRSRCVCLVPASPHEQHQSVLPTRGAEGSLKRGETKTEKIGGWVAHGGGRA